MRSSTGAEIFASPASTRRAYLVRLATLNHARRMRGSIEI